MSGTASDSDAETVITEGTIEGGKGNKEKAEMGKVSQNNLPTSGICGRLVRP